MSPGAQGRGLGTNLIYETIPWLTEAGFISLAVRVLDGNVRAMQFYQRLGFSPRGELQPSEIRGVRIIEKELILRL